MDEVKPAAVRRATGLLLVISCLALCQSKQIFVLRPAGTTFEEARKGILETLGPAYSLSDLVVDKETTADEVVEFWKRGSPKAFVAMDNRSIALFREARGKIGDSAIPLVAMMGVRVDAAIRGQSNAAAINYEIPAVTTIINLRSIIETPVKRAGMVYRASMEDLFRRNVEFCKMEHIELVGWKVPDDADAKSGLEKALWKLSRDESIDALVVVNDNFLLNANLLRQVWLPALSGWKHPVVVGVESLVKPDLRFGTFAILPDHYALGSQAAGLIQELEDDGWKVGSPRSDQPLSVIKVLNHRGMLDCCRIREGKIDEIDKILE